jgi:lipoate---protein ligase
LEPRNGTPWRYVADDGERDPRTNLAREEAIARHVGADAEARTPVLRLWRNAPCAVVGRFQLAAAEVDLEAAAALGAPVLRRFTGGGTVWHDPGNLNVSVVLRPEDALLVADPSLRRLPGLYRLVLAPLAAAVRSLGVEAELTDRDIVAPGGKLSGVAAWIGGRALLVHATLLVDADLDALARVCSGPGAPGDPRWERTRSRRVGVTSLARELGAVPAAADVEIAMLRAFGVAAVASTALSPAELVATERLLADRYAVPTWHADAEARTATG